MVLTSLTSLISQKMPCFIKPLSITWKIKFTLTINKTGDILQSCSTTLRHRGLVLPFMDSWNRNCAINVGNQILNINRNSKYNYNQLQHYYTIYKHENISIKGNQKPNLQDKLPLWKLKLLILFITS